MAWVVGAIIVYGLFSFYFDVKRFLRWTWRR